AFITATIASVTLVDFDFHHQLHAIGGKVASWPSSFNWLQRYRLRVFGFERWFSLRGAAGSANKKTALLLALKAIAFDETAACIPNVFIRSCYVIIDKSYKDSIAAR